MSPFSAANWFCPLLIFWLLGFGFTPQIIFAQANQAGANTEAAANAEGDVIIPLNLLKLIHTQEVQRELGLEHDQRLRSILVELDRVWWPSRILPEAEQQKTNRDLEARLLIALEPLLPKTALDRLREIEIQSQGTRSLARPEIAAAVGLSEQHLSKIKKVFRETDAISRELSGKPGGDRDLERQLQSAQAEEQRVISGLLTDQHRQNISRLVGTPFDTMALKRIYPLAPELVDSGQWAGAGAGGTSLEAERGKVVLVHFYAFQCHNCVANFGHYNRWHESLAKKGVTVIGIQTPETRAESDPMLVKRAATERGFEFPVLIDLQHANWNAWGNTMWPTVYVVDKSGYIRFWWQGELNWQGATVDKTIEKLVDELLAEQDH